MYIVGDSFDAYCDNKNSRKYSDAMATIDQSDENYQLGQGLTYTEFVQLSSSELIDSEELNKIEISMAHKHQEKNSAIINFRRDSEWEFKAGMYIHGDNDLLMDHITGLHIPGIALVEASRELFIVALSEIGYGNYRFVLNGINAEFKNYVFPINTQLKLRLECLKDSRQEKVFLAHINILQGIKECTGCTIKATLIPEALAKFSEHLAAKIN